MEEAIRCLLNDHYDLIIIGTGVGGATLAYGLKDIGFGAGYNLASRKRTLI